MYNRDELLAQDRQIVDISLNQLQGDEKLNYLYILRDYINAEIRKAK